MSTPATVEGIAAALDEVLAFVRSTQPTPASVTAADALAPQPSPDSGKPYVESIDTVNRKVHMARSTPFGTQRWTSDLGA